jgi:hypothetical protein
VKDPVKTAIYVSTLSNGNSIIHFGNQAELVDFIKYWCLDPVDIIPLEGFEIVSNFEIWKLALVSRGVKFVREIEAPFFHSNGSHPNLLLQ